MHLIGKKVKNIYLSNKDVYSEEKRSKILDLEKTRTFAKGFMVIAGFFCNENFKERKQKNAKINS